MRRLVAICGVVAAVCIISIVVAGLTSLVSLAERIHPLAGQIVFWLALAAIAVGVLWSLFAYSRMPAALVAPDVLIGSIDAADSPIIDAHHHAQQSCEGRPRAPSQDVRTGWAAGP